MIIRGQLYSERDDFADFHLRVEARVNDGGDSGVFFRSPFGPSGIPHPVSPLGYEADIHDRDAGSLFTLGENDSGPTVLLRGHSQARRGEWVTLEVIAEKNHITIKVNGATVVDVLDAHRRYTRGHIALQCWERQTQVKFRKIEIKELVGENRLASTAPEERTPETENAKTAEETDQYFEQLIRDFNSGQKLFAAPDSNANKQRARRGKKPARKPTAPFFETLIALGKIIPEPMKKISEQRAKPITEADIPGVWVHVAGNHWPQEITLLPNGKMKDPDGQNSWTLKRTILVLRWADPRAPGGFWIDKCTVYNGGYAYAGDRMFGSEFVFRKDLRHEDRFIKGIKGKLSPWFNSVAGKKAQEENRLAIEHRDAVVREEAVRRHEEWRRGIEAEARAPRIEHVPLPDTSAEDKRLEQERARKFAEGQDRQNRAEEIRREQKARSQ